ncbi:MAG TPA: response regulator [Geomonas sp.]|nr:response regulator [Geomonas sp.]
MTQRTGLPIIVVEDDIDVLSLIASLLRAHHFHRVVTFEDSSLALHFLEKSEAAAVVLDLSMPGLSGMDLLNYLSLEKPHIPAVVVTGEHQIETAVHCMKTGAIDYLTKPIQVDKLIDSVTRAVEMGRGGDKKQGTDNPANAGHSLIPAEVPERLCKAATYMEEHLSEKLYLESIAEQACMSKFHFSREFRKCFGVSPMQYMLRLRITRATSLLLSQDTPVSRVAGECGFSDQSEFTKCFKKSIGVTPSRFRHSLYQGKNKRLPH